MSAVKFVCGRLVKEQLVKDSRIYWAEAATQYDFAQGLAPTVSLWIQLHTCTHTKPCSTYRPTRTIYLLDTPHSSQCQYAGLHCSSADCGWAASICSVFGWGWAGGWWGVLEVGQGFQKTSAAPSQEQLSCLGTQPLNNCLLSLTHLHTSCKPLLRQCHTWGGYRQEYSAHSHRREWF